MVNPLYSAYTNTSAMSRTTEAIAKEQQRFSEAATELTNSFTSEQNAMASKESTTLQGASAVAANESQNEGVLPSIIKMTQSETAFKANLEAFKTLDELQEEVLNTFKKDI